MSQFNSQHGPIIEITENVVVGPDGEEVLRSNATSITIHHPDGTVERQSRYEHPLLPADGASWNPASSDKAEGQLGICGHCGTIGRLYFMRICIECGASVCSRHRRLGDDGKWRCIRCARTQKAKAFLFRIFFSEG